MLGKTTTLKIQTPEGVSFQLPIASPFSRCLALSLDFAVVTALTMLLRLILIALAMIGAGIPGLGSALRDFGTGATILIPFLIITFYGITFEWIWRGQTIGKRLMKLRVIDERGLPLSFKQILIRNIFRAVDILPAFFYLVGGISCVLSKRCQRLGDLAAGTLVIREVQVEAPEISGRAEVEENSFASVPHLEARLRQRTTPEEARIALDSVIRRDEMEDNHRLKVFAGIADYFRGIADFPDEITHGLSDEQYVRNVVDSLYRRASV